MAEPSVPDLALPAGHLLGHIVQLMLRNSVDAVAGNRHAGMPSLQVRGSLDQSSPDWLPLQEDVLSLAAAMRVTDVTVRVPDTTNGWRMPVRQGQTLFVYQGAGWCLFDPRRQTGLFGPLNDQSVGYALLPPTGRLGKDGSFDMIALPTSPEYQICANFVRGSAPPPGTPACAIAYGTPETDKATPGAGPSYIRLQASGAAKKARRPRTKPEAGTREPGDENGDTADADPDGGENDTITTSDVVGASSSGQHQENGAAGTTSFAAKFLTGTDAKPKRVRRTGKRKMDAVDGVAPKPPTKKARGTAAAALSAVEPSSASMVARVDARRTMLTASMVHLQGLSYPDAEYLLTGTMKKRLQNYRRPHNQPVPEEPPASGPLSYAVAHAHCMPSVFWCPWRCVPVPSDQQLSHRRTIESMVDALVGGMARRVGLIKRIPLAQPCAIPEKPWLGPTQFMDAPWEKLQPEGSRLPLFTRINDRRTALFQSRRTDLERHIPRVVCACITVMSALEMTAAQVARETEDVRTDAPASAPSADTAADLARRTALRRKEFLAAAMTAIFTYMPEMTAALELSSTVLFERPAMWAFVLGIIGDCIRPDTVRPRRTLPMDYDPFVDGEPTRVDPGNEYDSRSKWRVHGAHLDTIERLGVAEGVAAVASTGDGDNWLHRASRHFRYDDYTPSPQSRLAPLYAYWVAGGRTSLARRGSGTAQKPAPLSPHESDQDVSDSGSDELDSDDDDDNDDGGGAANADSRVAARDARRSERREAKIRHRRAVRQVGSGGIAGEQYGAGHPTASQTAQSSHTSCIREIAVAFALVDSVSSADVHRVGDALADVGNRHGTCTVGIAPSSPLSHTVEERRLFAGAESARDIPDRCFVYVRVAASPGFPPLEVEPVAQAMWTAVSGMDIVRFRPDPDDLDKEEPCYWVGVTSG